jgi:hypothetical protein
MAHAQKNRKLVLVTAARRNLNPLKERS